MIPFNAVPASLIVAAFAWQTPALDQQQVIGYAPLDRNTLAVAYPAERRIVLRDDQPAWPKQLTCTILVKAVGAIEGRESTTVYRDIAYRPTRSCGYVFGVRHRAAKSVRAPDYSPPLPQ